MKKEKRKMKYTKPQVAKRPADLPEYQETDAEKAARHSNRVSELEARTYLDGTVRYCVPGLEPDTGDTLEAAGLIKREYDKRGRWVSTTVFWPDNPRVRAWQARVNRYSVEHGESPPFPDLGFDVISDVADSAGRH
jgi:hypothetical protein